MDFSINQKEKITLLKTARLSIKNHLLNENANFPEDNDKLRQECGAFVTLHKNGALRGCIGYVSAIKPLIQTIKEVAVSAAFKDPRFPPLTKDEYPAIDLEISVMSPFKAITNIEEIIPGKHGLIIRSGFSSGLLLPQVATEYKWDRETFLTHTCYKAGLHGDAWKSPETTIEIFSAIVFGEKEMAL